MVKKANKSGDYRSFKIEGSSIGFEGGKFISSSPASAAKKAGRKLHKMIDTEAPFARYRGDKLIQVIIRETTLGSAQKLFAYDIYKVKLSTPTVRTLPNGSEYTIDFEYKIKALKEQDMPKTLRPLMQNAA